MAFLSHLFSIILIKFKKHLFSIILIKFKKHLFSVLVFSLPDPWVHKTPTYFAVKAYTCVFVYQVFSYTANKEIRTDDLCLDVSKLNGPVTMLKCHHLKGNQLWEYDPVVSYIPVENRNKSSNKIVCQRVYYINYFIPERMNAYGVCIL